MSAARPAALLVTGFGPFPHVRINPTSALARQVARTLRRAGIDARALVLETSYAGGLPALAAGLARERPRAVLMLGLAARERAVRVERFGRGRASLLHPDARGAGSARERPDAPLPARSTARIEAALACLRRAGLRARLSACAGRYLCDSAYALALRGLPYEVPVIFIHIPWPRPAAGTVRLDAVAGFRPSQASLARTLAGIGRALACQGRLRHGA
jgi:pyroglutamyl-peptidase